ncbi:hypothetical protein B0T24DRAFT_684558 [Lasiosphaeria ovina]|uniref:Arylamine N-acetyltransferase n=1 Tax=Lasiosphaeria ovina TaxID=92902 RepID=A0AAE0JU02_9PEZI|nr:hypothetical protein B0T24DRAFT_684558 [Lasiosphaeria ovina]
MATYSDEQLARYFAHIGYQGRSARQAAGEDALEVLTTLQRLHLARVPFESLTLHYSRHRLLSLDPAALFDKIVGNSRGGYCMEVNTFFATVLRSLGFTLISVGGRVRVADQYTGWSHMANLVTINNTRYLVDVGFGSNGPPHPVPLVDGHEFVGIAPVRGRLQHRALEEHTDPNQRVWVYSTRDDAEGEPWRDQYAFVELEFLPADFEVMNLHTMTAPQSYFVQTVLCMRTLLDERAQTAHGVVILHKDYVKTRVGAVETIETLETEEQRVRALDQYFKVVITPDEQKAICGLASELRPKGPSP